MNPAAEVWEKVKSLMSAEMTATTLNTWFDDAEALALEDSRFILYSPTRFKQEIIHARYITPIQNALRELFSADFQVTVLTEGQRDMAEKPRSGDFLPGTEEYIFDRFIVGESNKYAHAAARKVAENPGLSYNPLFIYGESGLGKTHLLYAIAHAIHADHPEYKIIYVNGDTFANELVTAIGNTKTVEFRNKYRQADVFLMDDVQFLARGDFAQEEMFHTFNTLYEQKKQIAFTSDRPPKELFKMDDRLRTRFEWGLLIDIHRPDYETRKAIIKSKAIRMGLELPDYIIDLIAENITANVRQIEGTINKITAFQDLDGDKLDKNTVIRAIKDIFKERADIVPTADVIIEEVCGFYSGLEPSHLRGESRAKNITLARQIAMYLIRSMTNLSLKEIGREFNRDHTTVLSALNRVEDMMETDPEKAEIIKDITTNINSRYE